MSRGRSPSDISNAEGNLNVIGDVQPNISRLDAVYGHSLVINPSLGIYQEIHPCGAISIYSAEINPSLVFIEINNCQSLRCHLGLICQLSE